MPTPTVKECDVGLMGDITPLLSGAVRYDAMKAMELVRKMLIEKIPGEGWRGTKK